MWILFIFIGKYRNSLVFINNISQVLVLKISKFQNYGAKFQKIKRITKLKYKPFIE